MPELTEQEVKHICKLAGEGRQISKIRSEHYPKFDYSEIMFAALSGGERSSRGVKRMITTRLNALAQTSNKRERTDIADELHDLVWRLYSSLKANHAKLDKIRKALE